MLALQGIKNKQTESLMHFVTRSKYFSQEKKFISKTTKTRYYNNFILLLKKN